MVSFCLRKTFFRRQSGYWRELLYWYQLMENNIDNLLLRPDHLISPRIFLSVYRTAVRLKEFDYATAFKHKYQHKLPQPLAKETEDFNNAALAFYQGQFELVQEFTDSGHRNPSENDLKSFWMNINWLVVIIKSEFEMLKIKRRGDDSEYKTFDLRLKDLDKAIPKMKTGPFSKQAYKVFVIAMNQLRVMLEKMHTPYVKLVHSDFQKLESILAPDIPISDWEWLEEQQIFFEAKFL